MSLTTTVGAAEDAQRLAAEFIDRRLAACVQVDAGLISHYRWEGRTCADPEWRLTVKTMPELRSAIDAFMAEQHPYELPQLLWQAMEAGPAYAAWVRDQVTDPAA